MSVRAEAGSPALPSAFAEAAVQNLLLQLDARVAAAPEASTHTVEVVYTLRGQAGAPARFLGAVTLSLRVLRRADETVLFSQTYASDWSFSRTSLQEAWANAFTSSLRVLASALRDEFNPSVRQ